MHKTFSEKRDEVINYIRKNMIEQGASEVRAVGAVTCIFFWKREDVENLYNCIHSDLDETVKQSIVAHDYIGLSRNEEGFLPKSIQFAEKGATTA